MRFVLRRLIQGLAVIVVIIVIVFFAVRVVSDPADILLPVSASEEARAALRAQLGLDRPVLEQFVSFVGSVIRLDFGDSYVRDVPALSVVLNRFPRTIQLVGLSMALATMAGVSVGALAALRPGSWFDRTANAASLVAVSMPQFWLGLILILAFSVVLGVLPSSGIGEPAHMILPVTTLAIPPAARFAVVTRSSMVDEMGEDYIRMDIARGLPMRTAVRHALRAIAVTLWSVIGYEFVYTMAGHSVVVETVFAWPGIGSLVTESLANRDLALIQAVVAFVGVLVVVMNLLLDWFLFAVDPRIAVTADRLG